MDTTPRTNALQSRFSQFRPGDLGKLWDHARELEIDLRATLDALRELRDHQNGPPLETWRHDWQAAMDKTDAILTKHNS